MWMGLEKILLDNNPDPWTNIAWLHLYELPGTGKFVVTEIRIEVYQGLGMESGKEEGSDYLIDTQFLLGMMKKVWV